MIKKILIVGAGGIGRACGLILLRHFENAIDLTLADINPTQCNEAESWIKSGITKPMTITKTIVPHNPQVTWDPKADLLLDCTPGKFAANMAQVALRNHMHYANLTENVPATRAIYEIAKDAKTGFALQTGLAPGFINQLARKMVDDFIKNQPTILIDRIKMRVGALSQYASSPSFYAFIWNPLGVSTEYLNESEIIDNYIKTSIPSLSFREEIVINGVKYEADITSGGAADLPDFFDGKVRKMNYKTIRYPGHFDYIDNLKNQLGPGLTIDSLLQRMMVDVPFHIQDRVLIYCSVSGRNTNGNVIENIRHLEILPLRYGQVILTAIQRTTAASLAQTAILLLSNRYGGILTQSGYPKEEFLNGDIIREHYGNIFEGDE